MFNVRHVRCLSFHQNWSLKTIFFLVEIRILECLTNWTVNLDASEQASFSIKVKTFEKLLKFDAWEQISFGVGFWDVEI